MLTESLKNMITLHTLTCILIANYGYTSQKPPNADILDQISSDSVDAITSVYGTKFAYGPISTTIYPASGSTVDYFYQSGVSCSFTAELRDTGKYGFLLPADQIAPVAEEMAKGYAVVMQNVVNGNCPKNI